MHNKYKLSICIPTYNRAKYLPELLDSILSQPESEQVEIAISDNASTDNTEVLIKAYQRKYKNIVYLKLPENLGPDRNYFKAVEISSGEYSWLMGSDDKLDAGALAKVVSSIKTNKDIYLQDRVECDINMSFIRRRLWWSDDVKELWDFRTDSLSDYFEKCESLGGVFSFLSSIVVKNEMWNKFIPGSDYYSTAYSHVYTLLSILREKGTLVVVKNSGVMSRGGNDHFLKEGMCKRALIDIEGFILLSNDLKLPALKDIVQREHSYKTLSHVFMGCISNREAYAKLKTLKFSNFQILFIMSLALIRKALLNVKGTSNT